MYITKELDDEYGLLYHGAVMRSQALWEKEEVERDPLWDSNSPLSILSNLPDKGNPGWITEDLAEVEFINAADSEPCLDGGELRDVVDEPTAVGQKRQRAPSLVDVGKGQLKKKKNTWGPKTDACKKLVRNKQRAKQKEKQRTMGQPRRRSEAVLQRVREKKALKRALRYWVGVPSAYRVPVSCEGRFGEAIELPTNYDVSLLKKAQGAYVGINRPIGEEGEDDDYEVEDIVAACGEGLCGMECMSLLPYLSPLVLTVAWFNSDTQPILDKNRKIVRAARRTTLLERRM